MGMPLSSTKIDSIPLAPLVCCRTVEQAFRIPLSAQPHPLAPRQFADQLVGVESQHCALPAGPHHGLRAGRRAVEPVPRNS